MSDCIEQLNQDLIGPKGDSGKPGELTQTDVIVPFKNNNDNVILLTPRPTTLDPLPIVPYINLAGSCVKAMTDGSLLIKQGGEYEIEGTFNITASLGPGPYEKQIILTLESIGGIKRYIYESSNTGNIGHDSLAVLYSGVIPQNTTLKISVFSVAANPLTQLFLIDGDTLVKSNINSKVKTLYDNNQVTIKKIK